MASNNCGSGSLDQSLSIVLVFASFAFGCSSKPPTNSDPTRPVKTMVVTAGDELHVRSFPGKAEASRNVTLAFKVSGLIVTLPVKEGQKVAKGDVIAQLRQDEFEARLKTLQSQLDQSRAVLRSLRQGARPEEQKRLEAQVRAAEAQLANARAAFERNERGLRTNVVSRADFDASD